MLALREVTKELGKGRRRRVVLNDISWLIRPRAKLVILGHSGSGKTTLLRLLSGADVPTRGWVERRGVVSPLGALTRLGSGRASPRQLIERLSPYFHFDPEALATFVDGFADLGRAMDRPIGGLDPKVLQLLNLALFCGIPCDYYLFDQRVNFGPREMQDKTRQVLQERYDQAGMILTTSQVREARAFEGAGAILHRGRITQFETVEDAIEVFLQIEPDMVPEHDRPVEEPEEEPEEFDA